jgi:hypothetical protein
MEEAQDDSLISVHIAVCIDHPLRVDYRLQAFAADLLQGFSSNGAGQHGDTHRPNGLQYSYYQLLINSHSVEHRAHDLQSFCWYLSFRRTSRIKGPHLQKHRIGERNTTLSAVTSLPAISHQPNYHDTMRIFSRATFWWHIRKWWGIGAVN